MDGSSFFGGFITGIWIGIWIMYKLTGKDDE